MSHLQLLSAKPESERTCPICWSFCPASPSHTIGLSSLWFWPASTPALVLKVPAARMRFTSVFDKAPVKRGLSSTAATGISSMMVVYGRLDENSVHSPIPCIPLPVNADSWHGLGLSTSSNFQHASVSPQGLCKFGFAGGFCALLANSMSSMCRDL